MLALEGVTAGYGSTTVLRDVSVEVAESTVVALLGPNGAGKTTLLRTAAGLLRPQAGRVLLDGVDISGWSPHRRAEAGICLVPEGRGVFGNLTVRENLVLFSPRGEQHVGVEKAVEAFPELGRRLNQAAATMSGGEQQMLALARTYVQHPRYVLLDEVSMGLAPLVVDRIFEFVQRLARNGAALLLVEQYVTRALELADRFYLLGHGRVSASGESSEVETDAVFAEYVGGGIADVDR
jgi:branched-chain amino acid transport system ATP-binding protein